MRLKLLGFGAFSPPRKNTFRYLVIPFNLSARGRNKSPLLRAHVGKRRYPLSGDKNVQKFPRLLLDFSSARPLRKTEFLEERPNFAAGLKLSAKTSFMLRVFQARRQIRLTLRLSRVRKPEHKRSRVHPSVKGQKTRSVADCNFVNQSSMR